MDCHIVYLKPVGSGTVRSDLRSDTLWGAICWAIRLIESEEALLKFIRSYEDDISQSFLLSSAFPYAESYVEESKTWEKTHFFPKSKLKNNVYKLINEVEGDVHKTKLDYRKTFKKEESHFLRQTVFQSLLSGRSEESDSVENRAPQVIIRPMTHNTINRMYGGTLTLNSDQGQLFHTDDSFLKSLKDERSGWFFLIQGNIERISPALRFLEHFGIGGDRSIGKGRFSIEGPYPFSIKTPSAPNAQMTLSLYRPKESELVQILERGTNQTLNYTLEERQGKSIWKKQKGKNASQRLDKAALFFQEGSVFPIVENAQDGIFGCNLSCGTHPAGFETYRYGHAFMVPLKIK